VLNRFLGYKFAGPYYPVELTQVTAVTSTILSALIETPILTKIPWFESAGMNYTDRATAACRRS
jgi:hypothetical protein